MKLNVLAGTLLGFTFAFLVFGLIESDFEWIRWIITMAAGIGGHWFAARLQRKKTEDDSP